MNTMIESFLAWFHVVASTWGGWGIFFLAFLQEVIPPIPSTLVSLGGGLLLVGDMDVNVASVIKLMTHVSLPLASGMTLGALIVYGVVYWGGSPVVHRFGYLVGISWDDIEGFKSRMSGTHTDEIVLFIARSFPLMPSILVNVVCGILRWNPISFFLSTFFGTVIRATVTGFIGWQLGNAVASYSDFVGRAHTTVIVVSVLAVGAFFVYRRHKAKQSTEGQ